MRTHPDRHADGVLAHTNCQHMHTTYNRYSHSALRGAIALPAILEPVGHLRQREARFLGQRFLLVGRRVAERDEIRMNIVCQLRKLPVICSLRGGETHRFLV